MNNTRNNTKSTHIIITVPKNTHLDIIDDLHDKMCSPLLDENCTREFILEENSTLQYTLKNIKSSGKTNPKTCTSLTVIAHLVGANACAKITGLFYGTQKNNFTFNTTQHHQAPQAQSTVCIKSVLKDTAQFVCNSLIRIEKEAGKSVATQTSKNIVLSKHAHVISKPALEVLTHDAACKHGAAISTLNGKNLFYIQSRGIAPDKAEQILIDSFLR